MSDGVKAITAGKQLTGETAEIQTELRRVHGDCFADAQIVIPFDCLVDAIDRRRSVETRADVDTTSASLEGVAGTAIAPPLERLFENSTSMRLGFSVMPVERGKVSVPRISDNTALTWGDDGADAVEADTDSAAFEPVLAIANYLLRKTAIAEMSESVEMALRSNLVAIAQSGLDARSIRAIEAEAVVDSSAKTATYPDLISDPFDLADGIHAAMPSECVQAARPEALKWAAGTIYDAGSGLSIWEKLRDAVLNGGLYSSSHLAAPVGSKSNIATVAPMVPGGVGKCAVWGGGVGLVIDPYSQSNKGKIRMTVQLLAECKVIRSAAIKVRKVKHGA